jgi:FlaA1/EpsC-like NDP-sugar epimerase
MVAAHDVMLGIFAVLLAYSLRVGEWRIVNKPVVSLIIITCALWLAIAPMQGVYRSMLRFSGARALREIGTTCCILAVLLTVLLVILGIPARVPRTLSLLAPLMLFLLLGGSRTLLSALLRESLYSRTRVGGRRVLVYGAGLAGRELTFSIRDHPDFDVIGFIDDDSLLRRRRMDGYRIWHSSELEDVLRKHSVDEVLLAIPSASRLRRRTIIEQIRDVAPGVGVRSLPDLAQIASGKISVSDLREVQIEELLGREEVIPDPRLMTSKILSRCVMITGAGGSIGSELAKQIALRGPTRVVLAERSEYALYTIDLELRELCRRHKLPVEIEAKLVDVSDERDLERVFRVCRPETVFHAAAYKHVPLVEGDPLAGIRNNCFGTYNCCLLAEKFGVRDFTLISTDKAVRPSSVMGASKRVCELIVQARSVAQRDTVYSAVRFGNVLGSSGSVVPLFRRQISTGGPVTVTHREATRYFMTVSEAAQLVIQAGAMAEGGDIFLLEMGEPVRIYDLAKTMIQLSGLAVAAEDGRDGDIEIVEVGLRPGEKLHEELLIDNCGLSTPHPRIVKAAESCAIRPHFERRFSELLTSMEERDADAALSIIEELVASERLAEAAPSAVSIEPKPRIVRTETEKMSRKAPVATGNRALES